MILTHDGIVAACEKAKSRLHPRGDGYLVVSHGHIIHLHRQTGEYPCTVSRIEVADTITAALAMIVRGIEQVIAQTAQEEMVAEITVERLHCERIFAYL
jgi:hypothetical protein